MIDNKYSQPAQRRARKLRDQHGDTYNCVIEIRSGHPVGPIAPVFSPPLPVPEKYLSMDPNNDTRVIIEYDQWIDDLTNARQAYDEHVLKIANEMYGDAAAEKAETMPKALLTRAGDPPRSVEMVLARRSGNRWLRGVPGAPMPEEAERYFPKPKAVEPVVWGSDEAEEDGELATFPVYQGSRYITSDRRKFRDKDEAAAHEAELEAERAYASTS